MGRCNYCRPPFNPAVPKLPFTQRQPLLPGHYQPGAGESYSPADLLEILRKYNLEDEE